MGDVFLSDEELQLARMEFNMCDKRDTGQLNLNEFSRLYRIDYPKSAQWEIEKIFHEIDLNFDNVISYQEYLKLKLGRKRTQTIANEESLKRHFAVLDYHGNGALLIDEISKVLLKCDRTPGGRLLIQVLELAGTMHKSNEVTFTQFEEAINANNLIKEKEIASAKIRMWMLVERRKNNMPTPAKDAGGPKLSYEIEREVLSERVKQLKLEIINSVNDQFAIVHEFILSNYEDPETVFGSVKKFLTYLGVYDIGRMRRILESSDIITQFTDVMLKDVPTSLRESDEFRRLCDFLEMKVSTDDEGPLYTNRAYRKIFIYYCTLEGPTRCQRMNRTNFIHFTKDCRLSESGSVTLHEEYIGNCFIEAKRGKNKFGRAKRAKKKRHKHKAHNGLNFNEWLDAIALIAQKSFGLKKSMPMEDFEQYMKRNVFDKAKRIDVENLGPEISQPLVMNLLRENVWPLKQIFCFFGQTSMQKIEPSANLSLHDYLMLLKTFGILRSKRETGQMSRIDMELDTLHISFDQLSLQDVIFEFFAAKWDVTLSSSCAQVERALTDDISFREFIRLVQRLAVSLYRARTIDATDEDNAQTSTFNKPRRITTFNARPSVVANFGQSLSNSAANCKDRVRFDSLYPQHMSIRTLIKSHASSSPNQHTTGALDGIKETPIRLETTAALARPEIVKPLELDSITTAASNDCPRPHTSRDSRCTELTPLLLLPNVATDGNANVDFMRKPSTARGFESPRKRAGKTFTIKAPPCSAADRLRASSIGKKIKIPSLPSKGEDSIRLGDTTTASSDKSCLEDMSIVCKGRPSWINNHPYGLNGATVDILMEGMPKKKPNKNQKSDNKPLSDYALRDSYSDGSSPKMEIQRTLQKEQDRSLFVDSPLSFSDFVPPQSPRKETSPRKERTLVGSSNRERYTNVV